MAEESNDKRRYKAIQSLRAIEGEMAFHLDAFGDALAKREGYKEHQGVEALQFYLVQKHHWLPSQARSLSWDDLRFIFAEEMSGWTLPQAARGVGKPRGR